MERYQERVVKEKQELDEKLAKLDAFAGTDQFITLPTPEQVRMRLQNLIMQQYSKVLGERIEAFPSA